MSDVVAFTVAVATGQTVQPGQRVPFETVLTNEGGGWSTPQLEFQCHVTGYYLFNINVLGTSGLNLGLFMEGADNPVVSGHSTDEGGNTASSTAIMLCNTGQRVWVEVFYASGYVFGEANTGKHFSIFSGLLISEGGF